MTRIFTTVVFVGLALTSCGPRWNPRAATRKKLENIQTVAVLPFVISWDSERTPRGYDKNEISKFTIEKETLYQDACRSMFISNQKRRAFTVMDNLSVNLILADKGIKFQGLYTHNKKELAAALGVDAVLVSRASLYRPLSDLAATGINLVTTGMKGKTDEIFVEIILFDNSGKKIWGNRAGSAGYIEPNVDNMAFATISRALSSLPRKR